MPLHHELHVLLRIFPMVCLSGLPTPPKVVLYVRVLVAEYVISGMSGMSWVVSLSGKRLRKTS